MDITSIRLWAIILGLLVNSSPTKGDCCYVVVPKLVEAFNFYVAIQARHPDISTRNHTYHTEISFPNHYQIRESPKSCEKPSNATNIFTCTQGEDLFTARFLLFTPDNPNQEPSVNINIYNELCGKHDYCSKPTTVDKGLLSLGPLGVYPRPLAIATLCIFGTALLCGVYLVYRSQRVHFLTNGSMNRGCIRIRDGTSGRKILSLPFFMCGCCSGITVCNGIAKHPRQSLPPSMIEIPRQIASEVPNPRAANINLIRSLKSISVHELGSGLGDKFGSTLPKCSLIIDPTSVGEEPERNETSCGFSQDKISKQSMKSKLNAKADLYRTKSDVLVPIDHVKPPAEPEAVHITRAASSKKKNKEALLNISDTFNSKAEDSPHASSNQSTSRNPSIKKSLARIPSTRQPIKADIKSTPALSTDPKTRYSLSRNSSTREALPKGVQRTYSMKHNPNDKFDERAKVSRSSSLRVVGTVQKQPTISREERRTSQKNDTQISEPHSEFKRGRSMKRKPSARSSYHSTHYVSTKNTTHRDEGELSNALGVVFAQEQARASTSHDKTDLNIL